MDSHRHCGDGNQRHDLYHRVKLGNADSALKQIKEKKYFGKYLQSPKTIKLLGVGFDTTKRNIGDHILEILPQNSR